jgi:hypothetical protein
MTRQNPQAHERMHHAQSYMASTEVVSETNPRRKSFAPSLPRERVTRR